MALAGSFFAYLFIRLFGMGQQPGERQEDQQPGEGQETGLQATDRHPVHQQDNNTDIPNETAEHQEEIERDDCAVSPNETAEGQERSIGVDEMPSTQRKEVPKEIQVSQSSRHHW